MSRPLDAPAPVLVVPGLGGSGPDHWQTRWERAHPDWRRVVQRNWDEPEPEEWIATLDRYVAASVAPPVLVAHSLGCVVVVQWARRHRARASAALLVAPSDVDGLAEIAPALGAFGPMPRAPLPFPSVVVASTDDPYVSIGQAERFARSWGSRFVDIGAAGHVNAESGFGDWPVGEALLREVLDAAREVRT